MEFFIAGTHWLVYRFNGELPDRELDEARRQERLKETETAARREREEAKRRAEAENSRRTEESRRADEAMLQNGPRHRSTKEQANPQQAKYEYGSWRIVQVFAALYAINALGCKALQPTFKGNHDLLGTAITGVLTGLYCAVNSFAHARPRVGTFIVITAVAIIFGCVFLDFDQILAFLGVVLVGSIAQIAAMRL
jgi:hypothetical protein